MRCAIYGCSVNNKKKTYNGAISFHSFPKQQKLCKQWILLCHRKDKINTKTARICCKHFEESDFVPVNPLYAQYGLTLKAKRLKENAVPSLLLPLQKEEQVSTTERNLRIQNRTSVPSFELVIVNSDTNMELEEPTEDLDFPSKVDCSPQSGVTMVDTGTQVEALNKIDCSTQTDEIIPTYSQLQEEIVKLKAQCWKQKKTIDSVAHVLAKGQLRKLECPHDE